MADVQIQNPNDDNIFTPNPRRSSRLTGQTRPVYNETIPPIDEIAPSSKKRGRPSKTKTPKKESPPKVETSPKKESPPKVKTYPKKESPKKNKTPTTKKRERSKGSVVKNPAKKKLDSVRLPILTGLNIEYEENLNEDGSVKKSSKIWLNEAIRTFNKHYLLSVQEEQRRVQDIQEAREKKKEEAKGKKKEEENEEKEEKNPSKRPDLKAISKMLDSNTAINHQKRIGHVPGIEVGDKFYSRGEMVVVGMHSHWLNGIDFMGKEFKNVYPEYEFPLAVCVVLSGQYEDDLDQINTVVYTGQGGHDLLGNKKQIADQVLKRGNLALANNCEFKVPVRLVRGTQSKTSYSKKEYTYSGLYMVSKYWTERGAQNYIVYQYKLERLDGQKEINSAEVKFIREGIPKTSADLKGLLCEDISNGQENLLIPVTNTVDDEPFPPAGFVYSKLLQIPSSFKMPKTLPGCQCIGDCSESRDCPCAKNNGSDFVYVKTDKTGGARLVEAKSIVFECGAGCECSSCCINRTSQQGIKYHLEVFKTLNKGWAVKTWDTIPAGAPVCEYTGILRKTDDADSNHVGNNYIFDIDCLQTIKGLDGRETRPGDVSFLTNDMESDAPEYCIDAGKVGNVARFINHSCQPNLFVQCVLSSHRDFKLAKIMLFAADTIRPLQELTYDYGYALNSVVGPDGIVQELACHCGAAMCRKRLY